MEAEEDGLDESEALDDVGDGDVAVEGALCGGAREGGFVDVATGGD